MTIIPTQADVAQLEKQYLILEEFILDNESTTDVSIEVHQLTDLYELIQRTQHEVNLHQIH